MSETSSPPAQPSPPPDSPETPDKPVWEKLKTAGNELFANRKYSAAIGVYTEAIDVLEDVNDDLHNNNSDNEVTNANNEELAKIYSNRSAAKISLSGKRGGRPGTMATHLLRSAAEDGEMAVKLDPTYEKAHFRCATALLRLGEEDVERMIKHLDQLLVLYETKDKKYHEDKSLIKLLHSSLYFAEKRKLSPNWEHVKHKKNCLIFDPYGAADMTTFTHNICCSYASEVSVLMRPGRYKVTVPVYIPAGHELDIVADVRKDGDKVEIFTEHGMHLNNIFNLTGGKLNIRNVHLTQNSTYRQRNAIYTLQSSEVELTDCVLTAQYSPALGISDSSKLQISGCTFLGCYAGLVVTKHSTATIDGSRFEDCKIGCAVQNGGLATITKTEMSKIHNRGILCEKGGSGMTADGCTFDDGMDALDIAFPMVDIRCGEAVIKNCQFISAKGSGILFSGTDVSGSVTRCLFTDGYVAVWFANRASGEVARCLMVDVLRAFMITNNHGAIVKLDDNKIESEREGSHEVYLAPDDEEPTMVSPRHRVFRDPINVFTKEGLQYLKEKAAKNKLVATEISEDGQIEVNDTTDGASAK